MNLVEPKRLVDLVDELRSGRRSATEVVQAALARIDEVEQRVHAWVVVDAQGALQRARELDAVAPAERGALHGIPVGVKDIIDVRGLPTRCGSALAGDEPAAADAAIVRELRELGAVILGKTVTTEYAYFKPGPTANPHDLGHTPGGSSSGSAVAVATGMVALGVGTQTAASVTRPAAYCGVAGYVTAYGTHRQSGITGLSPSLDTIGFIAATAADLEYLHNCPRPAAPDRTTAGSTAPTDGQCTFVVWQPPESFGVVPPMVDALNRAARSLQVAGCRTEQAPSSLEGEDLVQAHVSIMAHEALQLRAAEAARPSEISEQLAGLFDEGRAVDEQRLTAARTVVAERLADVSTLLAGGGVLLAPAAQSSAPMGLDATGAPLLSRPWQAMGLPVVVVPGALDPETTMPLGLQVIGLPGHEAELFRAAEVLEEVLGTTVLGS